MAYTRLSRRIFVFILLVFGITAMTTPFIVSAQGIQPLVPATCSGQGILGGNSLSGACGLCDLIHSVHNFFWDLIIIALPLGAIVIVYGGIVIMTAGGNTGRVEEGRKIVITAVTGYAIALLSYIIINTVISFLVTNKFTAPWDQIPCNPTVPEQSILPPSGGGGAPTPPGTQPPPGGAPTGGGLSDAEARSQLTAAGINIQSTGKCSDPSNPTCTSVGGLSQPAVSELVSFQQACGCVTIVGGTETGHASHGTGIDTVDITYNPAATAELQKMGLKETPFSPGHQSGTYTCEPPGGGNAAVPCGTQAGDIHVEL